MGILYKDTEDIKVSIEIKQIDGKIELEFTANCGKFGADEPLAGYRLTPDRLLQILHSNDYSEDELI